MVVSLYANTPDADLVYYGDDEIVWDRINSERLKRGLPGLAAIGIPRPQAGDAQISANQPLTNSASTLGDFSQLTGDQKQQIGQLETRRAQLTKSLALTQSAQLNNQRRLERLQEQLANTTDPQQRAALLAQTKDLQTVLNSQELQIARADKQLETVSSEITQGLRAAFPGSPTLASLPGLPQIPQLPSLPNLSNLPVSLPINAADVLKTDPASVKIPGLSQSQLTGLLGSAAKTATAAVPIIPGGPALQSAAGAITASGGIGKFGATTEQLEKQGLLKPGTTKSFLSAPSQPTAADIAEAERINSEGGDITPEQVASNRRLNQVLSSPFSWTGKNGVSSLEGFTGNESLQSVTQQSLMVEGVDKLKSLGVITGKESPQQLATLVQCSAKFSPDQVAAWSKGVAPPDVTAAINNIAKDAQQAVDLVDKQLPTLGSIPKSVEGKVATVDRSQLDASFAAVLGDPKISLPSFGGTTAAGPGNASALSANTKDEDLTYTGNDVIVWDRINGERIRRGLPGLASIGYPRPPG